jgi:hypothetical protein
MRKDKCVLLALYGKGDKGNQWEIDALWYLIDGSDIKHLFRFESSGMIKKKGMDIFFNIFIGIEEHKRKKQDKLE